MPLYPPPPSAGAPDSADYLVGTSNGSLSGEIVVGATPGGELGGTWGSPTVDETHSGSSHAGLSGQPGSTDVAVADGGTGASTATAGFDALSPMTTAGDIIVGGAAGTRARLAKGSDSQVLTVDPGTHLLAWATPSSGFSDPMTTRGDIIIRNAANATARLGRGSASQVLTSDGTDVAWATPSSGFSDPMTTRGDIIVRNSSNATARLAVGSANKFLHSDGTDVAYAAVLPADLDVSADNTTADATTGHHGLLPKLDSSASKYLDGSGAWSTPAGGGSGAPNIWIGTIPPYHLNSTTIDTQTANDIHFLAFSVPTARSITTVTFKVTTQSGNMDVGIYDSTLTRLRSAGSTAVPAAGTRTISLTSLALTANTLYYLAYVLDNTTAKFPGWSSASTPDTGLNLWHLYFTNGSVVLPAGPITPTGSTGYSTVIAMYLS